MTPGDGGKGTFLQNDPRGRGYGDIFTIRFTLESSFIQRI